MEYRIDTNGYRYIYDPSNPYANGSGKVYEHIEVMCNHIQRKLTSDECVHHIDRDKTNNKLENLRLMTLSEHTKLHLVEDRNIIFETRECMTCGHSFVVTSSSKQKFCSVECARKTNKSDISREELFSLVWSMPTIEVANKLGISDVAVGKRCKRLKIPKPPRGYWAKLKYGKPVESTPTLIH